MFFRQVQVHTANLCNSFYQDAELTKKQIRHMTPQLHVQSTENGAIQCLKK